MKMSMPHRAAPPSPRQCTGATMAAAERTGGCLCGAVRYRLANATAFGACHCGMCRKFSGGVFLAVDAAPGDVSWESSESLRVFPSSEWAERGFCATCGSSLFWRLTAEGPRTGTTAIAAGTLDSLDGLAFDSEIYTDHKPAAYAFAGDRPRKTEDECLAGAGLGPSTPA